MDTIQIGQLENLENFLDINWYYRICTYSSLLLTKNVYRIFNIQKLIAMNWWLVKDALSRNLPECVYNKIKFERRREMKNVTRKTRKLNQEDRDQKDKIDKLKEYKIALIAQKQEYLEQIEGYRYKIGALEF